MRLSITVLLLAALAGGSPIGNWSQSDLGLPTLHKIKQEVLSPSYSCRQAADFAKGYEKTALFLSSYSKGRNSPDLLFDGACQSDDDFNVSTAGDNMSLIADLGPGVLLDNVSASRAFNLENVARVDAYSKFTSTAKVVLGHTYAVVINKSDTRGLFVFTVVGHSKNAKVDIKYAVKSYQILRPIDGASGFDWDKRNTN